MHPTIPVWPFLERQEVVDMQRVPVSLMPEGLLQGLPDDSVRDLFTYLMGNGPAAPLHPHPLAASQKTPSP